MSILITSRGMAVRALLCGALAGISLNAMAGPYLGGAGVYNSYRSDDVDDATGHKFFAGYRFGETPLMIEAAYLDLGDADVDAVPGADLNFSGYQLSLGYFDRFDANSDSGFWAKLGYYVGDSELRSGAGLIDSQTSHGVSLGFGADWMFLPFMGLRLELDDLLQVKDFGDDSNAVAVSLGLVFEIPVGRKPRRTPSVVTARVDSATAPTAAMPASAGLSEAPVRFFELDAERAAAVLPAEAPPAPAVAEPVAEAEPQPAAEPELVSETEPALPAAPAPQAVEPELLEPLEPAEPLRPAADVAAEAVPPADQMLETPTPPLDSVPVPPQTPHLRAAAPLRRQPMRNAVADVVVPRGAEVIVRGRMTNSDGQWRFVEYRGLAGWVPVENLVEP